MLPKSAEKIAKVLKAPLELILNLDSNLSKLSRKTNILDLIWSKNEDLIIKTLNANGLNRQSGAEDIYRILSDLIKSADAQLLDKFGGAQNLYQNGLFIDFALALNQPRPGFFIKREKALELLEAHHPEGLLESFGAQNIKDLVDQKGFASVFASLRFTQTKEWMHVFFDKAYAGLSSDDFEERNVEMIVLDKEWLGVAEKFMEKKFHNVSHLKELGIIFVIPISINTVGETVRMFSLVLHYLNEVPFYSRLFKKFVTEKDFVEKVKSLLRGDVPEIANIRDRLTGIESGKEWLVTQRYLTKDNPNDSRLFLPHLNPEAEHWYLATKNLSQLAGLGLDNFHDLHFVGDFFNTVNGGEDLISFDLVDLVMSMVQRGENRYFYHQREAFWNQIFIEYFGIERLNQLIEENIIGGLVKLEI